MPLVSIWRLLREYSSSSKVGTIGLYTERAGVFQKGKDWYQIDLFFEDSESGLFIGTPFPRCVFLGKIKERLSMMGETLNKPLIEISEAKEQFHLLVRWNRPFGNSGYFDRIHTDGIVRYDDSEILLGSGSRMEDSGLRRWIPKGLGLSLCAVPS
jgi:hypothetical protein